MNTQRDMLKVPEPTGFVPCKIVYVLPARYALCSDEKTSLGADYASFVNTFCPVPETEHHRYTLRLLRPKSYVYAFVQGDPTITQFTVRGDGTLRLADEKKSTTSPFSKSPHLSAKGLWLEVSKVDAKVWLAVSDAQWPESYRQKIMAAPGKRMQEFNPMNGKSSHSLVVAGDQVPQTLSRLVQEFRPDPGYLRGMHEYPGAPQYIFDPDLQHFEEAEFKADTVARRWQWSAIPFAWKYKLKGQPLDQGIASGAADPPDYPPALEPLARHCSMGIALADPVGLCMDCTRLNAVAMHACGDLTAWYGDAVALAALHRERRPFFRTTEQTRETVSATRPSGKEYPFVGDLLIEDMGKVWIFLKEPLAVNLDFWWANLCAEGDWTVRHAFGDFFRPGEKIAPDARRVLAPCVSALTINHEQAKKVWGWLDADEGLAFMDLVARAIRADGPDESCHAADEGSRNPLDSLGVLAAAFSGVLLRRRPDGSLPAAAQNLLEALSSALEGYLDDLDPKYPGMFLDLTLYEMEQLSVHDQPGAGTPREGMRFARWGCCRPGRLGRDQPIPPHSPSDPAPPGLLSTSGIYAWVPTEPRWNDLNDLSGLLKKGKSLQFTDEMRKTPSLASVMTVLKGSLAVGSAFSLLREGARADGLEDKLENWASVLTSVVSAAESAIHMVELREMYHVANAYHTLVEYSEVLAKSRAASAKLARLSTLAAKEGLYKFIQVIKTADKAATVLGVALSVKDAYECYHNEQYFSGLGNVFLTASGVAAFFGAAPVMVCTAAGVGLACLLIGETTRHDFLMERTYLGVKSDMRDIETACSEPATPNASSGRPLFGHCLAPFSYKKGMVPPSALRHAGVLETSLCKVWSERHDRVERSLGMIDLFELELQSEMEFDVEANRLYLFISATRVTSRSTLKILHIPDPTFHREFSSKEAEKLKGFQARVMEAAWESGVRKGMACWSCSLPWEYGSPLVEDRPYMGNIVSFLFPQGFHVEMRVEFHYCPRLPSVAADPDPLDTYAEKLEQYEQDLLHQENLWTKDLFMKADRHAYTERRRRETDDLLRQRNPMHELSGYRTQEKKTYYETMQRYQKESRDDYLAYYKKNNFRKHLVFDLRRTPYAIRYKGRPTEG